MATMRATETSKVRVLIVDDHPLVRRAIRMSCDDRPNIEVVGEAGTGHQALEEARRLQPDLILLDLAMPDLSGIEVVKQLRLEGSSADILILTGSDEGTASFDALRAGVQGYVQKGQPMAEVVSAIESMAAGKAAYSQESRHNAHEQLRLFARRSGNSAKATARFTPREKDVLVSLAEGLPTKQIARRLGVSRRTIETHISNVYDKLGVRGRVHALSRAAALGLINLDQAGHSTANPPGGGPDLTT
jgi:DNA-binding NarL/FixJ family response regulator